MLMWQETSAVCAAVEEVANIMGLPLTRVLPVKNYENETKLVTWIAFLALEALKWCLDLVDDFIEELVWHSNKMLYTVLFILAFRRPDKNWLNKSIDLYYFWFN